MIKFVWLVATIAANGPVTLAHDQHAQFHAQYQNWVNGNSQGCCNNMDCNPVSEKDLRESATGLELYVRGVGAAKGQASWCPVLSHHYLLKGNAPDWSSAHACITAHYGGATPCAQFICFQPKPSG